MNSRTFSLKSILYFRQILFFFLPPPPFGMASNPYIKRHYKFQTDILSKYTTNMTETPYETVRVGIQSLQTGIKSLQ